MADRLMRAPEPISDRRPEPRRPYLAQRAPSDHETSDAREKRRAAALDCVRED